MMTANSIKSKSFESERNGYSQAEVDRFLAEVANDYAALAAQNAENEEKIAKLVEKVSEYKEEEDAIKGALLSAQKEASKIVNDAKNKANAMVDSAKSEQRKLAEQSAAECEKIVREHKERCAALIKENTEITEQKINALRDAYDDERAAYEELRAEVTYFKANLTSLYQEQIKLVMQLQQFGLQSVEFLFIFLIRKSLTLKGDIRKLRHLNKRKSILQYRYRKRLILQCRIDTLI